MFCELFGKVLGRFWEGSGKVLRRIWEGYRQPLQVSWTSKGGYLLFSFWSDEDCNESPDLPLHPPLAVNRKLPGSYQEVTRKLWNMKARGAHASGSIHGAEAVDGRRSPSPLPLRGGRGSSCTTGGSHSEVKRTRFVIHMYTCIRLCAYLFMTEYS